MGVPHFHQLQFARRLLGDTGLFQLGPHKRRQKYRRPVLGGVHSTRSERALAGTLMAVPIGTPLLTTTESTRRSTGNFRFGRLSPGSSRRALRPFAISGRHSPPRLKIVQAQRRSMNLTRTLKPISLSRRRSSPRPAPWRWPPLAARLSRFPRERQAPRSTGCSSLRRRTGAPSAPSSSPGN